MCISLWERIWKSGQVIAVAGAIATAAGCGPGLEDSQVKPVLKNYLVDFQAWSGIDPSTSGAFLFDSTIPDNPINLVGSTTYGKLATEISFFTAQDAEVVSPIDGIVTRVAQKDGEPIGDMGIILRPTEASVYLVDIDHVKDVVVSEGQFVLAGDPLGRASDHGPAIGLVELHIVKDDEELNLCPGDFLDPEVKPAIEGAISQLMADIEDLKSDSSIYDESAIVGIGCYRNSIRDSEL